MSLAKPAVYLAGPMVFYKDLSVFELMKEICAHHGLEGFAPLDNQLGLEALAPGKPTVTKIVAADFDLMEKLEGALFCLDPFRRSTEMDPGTAVEIGYMIRAGKRLAGWTADRRSYYDKVRAFFGDEGIVRTAANSRGGTSGSDRDPDGVLIHSDGLVVNGMAQCGIELHKGKVYAHEDWRAAFEAAAMNLAAQFELAPQEPLYSKDRAAAAALELK
ncbi:MAG: nucleoside 2-deoxyribosyltransferase [Rhodomicrobium sp.]